MSWWPYLLIPAVPAVILLTMESEGTRLGKVLTPLLLAGVCSVPLLVATGVAPHWFWIFF